MTVRWKPLLILSGVFVAVALGGLVAFTLVRGSRGTEGILAKARAELKAKRFEEAEVEFKRALQREGRNPAIHLEFAGLYDEWLREAPADKRVKVELAHRGSLADAAKFGPTPSCRAGRCSPTRSIRMNTPKPSAGRPNSSSSTRPTRPRITCSPPICSTRPRRT
jgi:hypothetical protein